MNAVFATPDRDLAIILPFMLSLNKNIHMGLLKQMSPVICFLRELLEMSCRELSIAFRQAVYVLFGLSQKGKITIWMK